jgi:uncharacterized membrane protein
MTKRTFKIFTVAIAVALALIVSWSINAGNAYIPIIAVFVALGIKYLARKSTRDVLQDERTHRINEKASALTVQVCIPLAALAAIVLISLRSHISVEMYIAGNVMAYFSCIVMLVHVALYSYYNRKS